MGEGRGDDVEVVSELGEPDPPRRRRGRLAIVLGAAVCVVALVGVAIVAARPGDGDGGTDDGANREIVHSPEADAVIAAVGATTAAGSYTATYELHSTPATVTTAPTRVCTPTTTTVVNGVTRSGGMCSYGPSNPSTPVTITGRAIINTDPYRMVAESQVTGFGAITVRVDGTRLWEAGGGNYGLNGRDQGPGAPMSGFASLVSGTLGEGPGALTMLTLASPNGYLNLQKEAVAGVTAAGVGTVDGTPVTYYEVVIDPARILDVPGLTGEQTKTITAALAQLERSGYQSRTTKVGIDAAGLIRETTTVNVFADGSTQSTRSTFSNFGCAGIVQLPGDPAGAPDPEPCAATTPTTPPPPSTTVPATIPPATVPPATVPPTTATTTTRTTTTGAAPIAGTSTTSGEVDQYGQPVAPPGWKMPTINGQPACDRYGPACPGPTETTGGG